MDAMRVVLLVIAGLLVAGGVAMAVLCIFPAAIGLGAGFAASLALTRFLSSLLYEVRPADAAVSVGVALVLASVALLASWLPAFRASRVDPMVALRYE